MDIKEIIQNVYTVGVKDIHRSLFDQIMPLSEGTSYNSYLIKGSEKIALIDTVYAPFEPDIEYQLEEMGITHIDYIVLDHGEPDHTGALPTLLQKYPMAKIVTNAKCKEITMALLDLKDTDYLVVGEGQTLSLGDKTLEFHLMPWVHWPDTMFTYLKEDQLLFTTDFLGAHATKFDVFWDHDPRIIPLLKSYYAEIMMPFAGIFKKYLTWIEELNPKMIAPSHGPIYRDPSFVLDLYKKWISEEKQNKVVIVGVSMYGNTQKMIDYVSHQLKEKGIEVKYHNAIRLDACDLACDIVDCMGVIIATPTVVFGPHPAVMAPLFLVNMLKPNLRYFGLMGSYGWGTKIMEQITTMLTNMKQIPFLTPVLIKGGPKEDDFRMLDTLVTHIVQKHHEQV